MKLRLITVDWVELMCQLRLCGMTLSDIEAHSGIPESTLRGYAELGSQPPHWRGEIIITVWCSTLAKPREQLPTTDVYIAPRIVRKESSAMIGIDLENAMRGRLLNGVVP
jgi:hypothetical protein